MTTKSKPPNFGTSANKVSQNSSLEDVFDTFNNLQRQIFQNLFANTLKRPEEKSELINPKSPKTPKLSNSDAQVAKKSAKKTPNSKEKIVSPKVKAASPQNKVTNQKKKVASPRQKIASPKQVAAVVKPQNIVIQPDATKIQANPVYFDISQQPCTSAQAIKREKFEFKKIQPQDTVQQDIGSKILKKVFLAPQTILIDNLLIHNEFLYPEISILDVGSSKAAQKLESQGFEHDEPKVYKFGVQEVPQVPQIDVSTPLNPSTSANINNESFKSEAPQIVKLDEPVASTSQKSDQEIFKIPAIPKPSKKSKKQNSSDAPKPAQRRKSNPNQSKVSPPKTPKQQRQSAGQKKSPIATTKDARQQQLMKQAQAKIERNIYEAPRKSFSVPMNMTDENKGLRRGRSKFRNVVPFAFKWCEKEFEKMSQEEFCGVLGLMKN